MTTDVREVWEILGHLSAMVGIMDANITAGEDTHYEPALEGWDDRKQEIVNWAERQISEIPEFGSGHDPE